MFQAQEQIQADVLRYKAKIEDLEKELTLKGQVRHTRHLHVRMVEANIWNMSYLISSFVIIKSIYWKMYQWFYSVHICNSAKLPFSNCFWSRVTVCVLYQDSKWVEEKQLFLRRNQEILDKVGLLLEIVFQ